MPTLVALLARGKVARENQAEVLQLVASLGNADQQATSRSSQVLDFARLSAPDRVRILDALAQAARDRQVQPSGDLKRVAALFADENVSLAGAALRLAGAWKLEDQRERLHELARNPRSDGQRRTAAIRALVDLGGARSMEQLEGLCGDKETYDIRLQAIVGLTELELTKAAHHASVLLSKTPPAGKDPSALFAAFLERKRGPQILAKSLQERAPTADAARIGQRVLVERGVPVSDLQAVLQKAIGPIGAKRKLDGAEMKRWIALVQTQGDPARGEAVFRRANLGCQQCHALGGAGGRVGPDLSGIGTSAQLDYLIESVFLPSKVVREGYTTAHIVTKDGRSFSGVLARETAKEIVLKDPIRDEIVIAVKDIDEKRVGGSLMPDGLDQALTDAELADLFRFLAELGKPGPFAVVTHRSLARRWQYLDPLPATLQALDPPALGKLLHEGPSQPWKPRYAKVSGDVPLSDVASTADPKTAILRCQVDVVTPGEFSFQLKDAQGVGLWIDGKSVPDLAHVELARGQHTLVFRVDLPGRQESFLRLELVETKGSKGQARFVDGR